ncbi:MAG: glycerol-3-phosphate 1-O-acyltransferase PlsY [Clostridia bacterium]|nr:glycerol-3-phosphate 1-O-acyltransferase PlsY [Clostridia bacterium]
MIIYVKLILIALIAYLLGSINTSIIISKLKGTDIREHGSKNAGLTNTLRTFGKGTALIVLIGDILKAVIAIVLARILAPSFQAGVVGEGPDAIPVFEKLTILSVQIAGIAVVLGHIFPVYYGFKGGKGVLTSATVIFMINWKIGLMCLALFVIVVAITRYVSLGSVLTALAFPAIIIYSYKIPFLGDQVDYLWMALFLAILVIVKHRGNIVRLVKDEERKISFKKKDVEIKEEK